MLSKIWNKIPNKGTLLAVTGGGVFSILLLRFLLIPLTFSESQVEPTYFTMYIGIFLLMAYIYVSEILIQKAEKKERNRDNTSSK